jgi:hypothetical protein
MLKRACLIALVALLSSAHGAWAITINPFYASNYSLVDFGAAPSVVTPYGGLIIQAGSPNTLLLGGSANNANGVIDALGLIRDVEGHITGFSGTNTLFATAPNIDGGIAYAPNGTLLFTEYNNNQIGEIKPGSSSPSKTVTPAIASSVGTLQFVPAGFPGAGNFVIASYNASVFCTAPLTPDGLGTYNIGACSHTVNGTGGPEGIIYVPLGSALFPNPSMLVSEYSQNRVSAYEVDSNGLPNVATRRDFITGLSGAEGATLDPVTNDFLFSTFGATNHVVQVRGFAAPPVVSEVPEPASLTLLGIGLLGLARRRYISKR